MVRSIQRVLLLPGYTEAICIVGTEYRHYSCRVATTAAAGLSCWGVVANLR